MKNKNKDNYIIRILFFYAILIVAALIYREVHYPDLENSNQIKLETTVGDNQGYHPKVVAFDKEWNGYKYWMAFTPYPYGDETKENPVINVSNDLVNWISPKGLNNPLDIPNPSDKNHYNSDTHLLYDEKEKELELFWRYVNDKDNEVIIYRMTSKDGINWTDKEEFLVSKDRKTIDYVSPALILNNGIYKVWYVNKQKVFYLEKEEERITEPRVVELKYNNNYQTWHLDVIYNDNKNLYEMVTCAYTNVNHRDTMPLFYTNSKNNIEWSTPIKIMEASANKNSWDSQGLYRSSLLYMDRKYYLFYSGHDSNRNNGIGLMYGKNISALKAYI